MKRDTDRDAREREREKHWILIIWDAVTWRNTICIDDTSKLNKCTMPLATQVTVDATVRYTVSSPTVKVCTLSRGTGDGSSTQEKKERKRERDLHYRVDMKSHWEMKKRTKRKKENEEDSEGTFDVQLCLFLGVSLMPLLKLQLLASPCLTWGRERVIFWPFNLWQVRNWSTKLLMTVITRLQGKSWRRYLAFSLLLLLNSLECTCIVHTHVELSDAKHYQLECRDRNGCHHFTWHHKRKEREEKKKKLLWHCERKRASEATRDVQEDSRKSWGQEKERSKMYWKY